MAVLVESLLVLLALAVALSLRPWRLLAGPLRTPALAALLVLPGLWLAPQAMPDGLRVQLSGASLLVLMLGWPLAIPVLVAVGVLVWWLGSLSTADVLAQVWWQGVLPATIALGLGAVLRRWLPPNPFVYTLGRGFFATAAAVLGAGALWALVQPADAPPTLVAVWLMAWSDAFLTGALVAIFVAFAPQWLATWSDARYLRPPPDA